jgi:hypothetical protein
MYCDEQLERRLERALGMIQVAAEALKEKVGSHQSLAQNFAYASALLEAAQALLDVK